jgi:hypothetical protein
VSRRLAYPVAGTTLSIEGQNIIRTNEESQGRIRRIRDNAFGAGAPFVAIPLPVESRRLRSALPCSRLEGNTPPPTSVPSSNNRNRSPPPRLGSRVEYSEESPFHYRILFMSVEPIAELKKTRQDLQENNPALRALLQAAGSMHKRESTSR